MPAWRGAVRPWGSPRCPESRRRSTRRRSSSSISRRQGCRPRARASSRSVPNGSSGSSWVRRSRPSSIQVSRCRRPSLRSPASAGRRSRGAAADLAVRRFLGFAGDAVLVAHNARFDLGFLDRAVLRLTGRRVAAPVVDTVWLARRLLGGRTDASASGRLAHFFGTATTPCHRALADASATAEILVALIGLAQERGAETVADLVELAAPRARRLHAKRSLVAGAPTTPGVYVFRDAHGQALYVGRARDLRARLRSYFSGERQRPAVEAALAALAKVEWQPCGSELEAALDELRLLRELRPPANARSTRPDRQVYLRRRGARWVCGSEPTPHGPVGGRARTAGRTGARRVRGRGSAAALPGLRRGFVASPRSCASRMQPACAIASPHSSRWSSGSRRSTGCGHSAPAWSRPRSSPAWCARSSWPALWSPAERSRAVAVAGSRSTRGLRRRARDERRRGTAGSPTSFSSLPRSCGGRRPSCVSSRSSATRSSRRVNGVAWAA